MAAPQGNQFWKLRTKHGRDKLFSSPEILWEAACEYFQWCDEHPWRRNEAVKAGDHFGESVYSEIARPYTLSGLCIYLDITQVTLFNYGEKEEYKDFFNTINKIKEIIYTQKFEGAAVNAFNASIIARDLKLTENIDHTTKGEKISLNITVDKEETADTLKKLMNDGKAD